MRLSFNGDYPITNPFGVYDPSAYANYPGMKHPGTDWGLPANTPLVAGMSGRVTVYRRTGSTGRGNEVVISDGNLKRKTCHMSRVDVTDGQWVNEGDQIGLSGYTGYVVDYLGRVGTPEGAHLHDELLIDGVYVDVREHLNKELVMDFEDAQGFYWNTLHRDPTKGEVSKDEISGLVGLKPSQAFDRERGSEEWLTQNHYVKTWGTLQKHVAELEEVLKEADAGDALKRLQEIREILER